MASTFDEKALLENVDNDIGFISETLEMLRVDAPGLLEKISQALASGDAPAVGSAAHALKGMVSNFCAATAQASALEVERMGKSGNLSCAPAAVEALRGHVSALTAELTEFVRARA
jgi:HPt (histidine-containing phosphotransfer) domain-containing protein